MNKRSLIIIFFLTIIFSIVIFFLRLYFFSGEERVIEEEYIDKSLYISLESSDSDIKNSNKEGDNNITKGNIEKFSSGSVSEGEKKNIINYKFSYIPKDFEINSLGQTTIIKKIITSSPFDLIISNLGIDLYKDKFDVRGKMKNGKVKLFGLTIIKNPELVSVFIHELAHYIDIYYLNKDNFEDSDYSHKFYEISWDSAKIIKPYMTTNDFVSGYSMTNKYEDFAESFTYYVLHNGDFKEKATKSDVLRNKYDFFGNYLFKNKEFISIDFGKGEEIKGYYWDITKIDINLENFLQYFKNTI